MLVRSQHRLTLALFQVKGIADSYMQLDACVFVDMPKSGKPDKIKYNLVCIMKPVTRHTPKS